MTTPLTLSASVPSLDDCGSAKQRECLRVGWATVFFPESRNVYARMLNLGWVEAMRRILLGKGIYTYWNFSYRGGYDRSSGLRMDHLLIRPLLAQTIKAITCADDPSCRRRCRDPWAGKAQRSRTRLDRRRRISRSRMESIIASAFAFFQLAAPDG
ncbi:hypothetical protein MPLDJ20_150026 [Mesorhizobium plurifarium]|uniref:Uncharacterized protein n=1 Tax=Mesorhizobium plurifarium TaxID=69974 RepID=A0A090ES72_MESPL|nr:hypothetical protein MPLDJ20_150026 [Mesorhizobium plurifarium]